MVLANWRHYDVTVAMYWATICALLQTNSSCRRAVQCASAQCSAYLEVTDVQKLAQFCAWLPQHAGLVDSLSVQTWDVEPAALAANWPAAEPLITTALQQSVLAGSRNPAMDALGGASGLSIRSCSIVCPTSPALLDALAAVSSLTDLSLSCASSQPTAAVCAALGRLRNIQKLHLDDAKQSKGVVTAELALAVQQLQQLTSLWLEHCMHPDLLQHLPTGMQELCVFNLGASPGAAFVPAHELPAAEPIRVDLQHLTRLTSLCLNTLVPLSGDSVLPKELITLYAHGPCNFHPSSKLESLLVTAPQQSLGLMQFLPKLPHLQDLSVRMSEYCGDARDAEFAAVLAAVQQATQVTVLDWNCGELRPRGPERAAENAVIATNLGIGSVLAGLTHLRKLDVVFPGIPESELSKLTALTSPEKLGLSFCGEGVTDAVVVALASRLRKLQDLRLTQFERHYTSLSHAVWPALVSLTALSSLDVQSGPLMGDQDLQQLTALTGLQLLLVTNKASSSLSDEGRASFLAAMPQLTLHNLSDWH